jgi:hypothetical protein
MRKQPNPLTSLNRPLFNSAAVIFDFSMSCALAFVIAFVLVALPIGERLP